MFNILNAMSDLAITWLWYMPSKLLTETPECILVAYRF